MAAIKVCMWIPSFHPSVGGAEKQLEYLCQEFVQQSDVECFVLTRRLKGTQRVEKLNGTLVYRKCAKPYPYAFLAASAWFLAWNRRRYDVIHIHTLNSPAQVGAIVGAVLGKPVIIKVTRVGEGSSFEKHVSSRWRRGIFKLMTSLAAKMVSVSSDIRSGLLKAGLDPTKISSIPNGVRLFERPADPKSVHSGRDSLGIERNAVVHAFVGRLIRRKRVDWLLRAWKQVGEHRKGCWGVLLILGDGPERVRLERLAQELGISAQIRFLGRLAPHQVQSLLALSDTFVLPSWSEGLSNALLEAMSAGLMVISARVSGSIDLIDDGVNGLLFTSFSELVEQLAVSSRSADFRMRCGEKARETIKAGFALPSIARQYRALYQEVCSQRLTQ